MIIQNYSISFFTGLCRLLKTNNSSLILQKLLKEKPVSRATLTAKTHVEISVQVGELVENV